MNPQDIDIIHIEGKGYVLRDKKTGRQTPVSGITGQINKYFNKYQSKLSRSSQDYLSAFSVSDLEKVLKTNLYVQNIEDLSDKKWYPKPGGFFTDRAGVSIGELHNYVQQQKIMQQGTDVHAALQLWIETGKVPNNPKARKLIDAVSHAYPKSKGWEYSAEVPVSDFNKYATQIDLVLKNKHTGETVIADWKTGGKHQGMYGAQLSFEKQMLERTTGVKASSLAVIYPDGIKPVKEYNPGYVRDIFYGKGFFKTRNISIQDEIELKNAKLGIAQMHTRGFHSFTGKKRGSYSQEITLIDTETGHLGEVLSVAAIKGRVNNVTKEFEVVDTYERYYYPSNTHSGSWYESQSVHKLSPAIVQKLRKRQKADYDLSYSANEVTALKNFIGGSTIAGQNITEFDLAKLKLENVSNNILDLIHASRQQWPGQSVSQENVLRRIKGAAYKESHSAFMDALDSADILTYMYGKNSAVRFVAENYGYSLLPYDTMLENMVGHNGLPLYKLKNPEVSDYAQVGVGMGKDFNPSDYIQVNRPDGETEYLPKDSYSIEGGGEGGYMGHEMMNSMVELMGYMNRYAQTMGEYSKQLSENLSGANYLAQSKIAPRLARRDEDLWSDILTDEYGISDKRTQTKYVNKARRIKDILETEKGRKEQAALEEARHNEWLDQLRQEQKYNLKLEAGRESLKERADEVLPRNAAQAFKDTVDAIGDTEIALKGLNKELEKQARTTNALVHGMAQIPMYHFSQWYGTQREEWSGIKHAMKGVMPAWYAQPISKFGDAFMNVMNRRAATLQAGEGIASTIGGGFGMALGGAFGGAPGAMVGSMIGKGIVASISQVVGNLGNMKIRHVGERIQEGLNLHGGILDIILMPLRALAKIISGIIRLFGALAGAVALGIHSMKQLATPLTSLTGVHFPMQQGLEAAGHLTGLGKDAYGNAYNTFANEAQALYTTGQLNRDRLVAASMLGVFGDVYNPTADADEMYGGTVNKILAQLNNADPTRQKQLMTLAGRVDSTLPQTLQVMKDLGITDWKQMRTYAGYAYFRPHTDDERKLYRRQSFQFQGNIESIMNSIRRIVSRLWAGPGHQIMDFINKFLDGIASAMQAAKGPDQIWKIFTGSLKEGWNKVKDFFQSKKGGEIISFLKSLISPIVHILAQLAHLVIDIWSSIAKTIITKSGDVLAYLGTIRIGKDENGHLVVKMGADETYSKDHNKWLKNNATNIRLTDPNDVVNTQRSAYFYAHKFQQKGGVFDLAGQTLAFRGGGNIDDYYELMDIMHSDFSDLAKRGEIKSRIYQGKFQGLFDEETLNAILNGQLTSSQKALLATVNSVQATGHATVSTLEGEFSNAVNLNISVNDKPMFNVKATEAGVTVAGGAQRYDIGGYVIKTDVQQSLAQLGLQRR